MYIRSVPGIHAREWISPAVVSYLIREFSERAITSEDILANFTLYIIPVLNPDGYEYSHTRKQPLAYLFYPHPCARLAGRCAHR